VGISISQTMVDKQSRSLSKNHIAGVEGGVTPSTYIAFIAIECMA
jgi:hypothetical protein